MPIVFYAVTVPVFAVAAVELGKKKAGALEDAQTVRVALRVAAFFFACGVILQVAA